MLSTSNLVVVLVAAMVVTFVFKDWDRETSGLDPYA